ncbi:gliding motility-associated protein GldE [Carboxylicivirga linearis]|uniref:Gliding motility-associated protein GldE n=2 Tax=Carboxylicivirga linearis TaxID=1628157 RepID=A0ABS5JRR6_9BACT|nr:gliding motility-associated protein GldE [Carboxylicivirga linearis]
MQASAGVHFLPLTVGTAFAIILNLFFLLSSGLISGSEVAYFSLEPIDLDKLKEKKSRKNKLILEHLVDKETLLATILIGNNFVNVAIVILTSYITSQLIVFNGNTLIQIIIEIVFITSIILFFGEILPKVYASKSPVTFAGLMAFPLWVLTKILSPLSFLLTKSTGFVNRRLTRRLKNLSMDDISHALELTGNDITDEKEILEGIVKFGNINVVEIMTARVDVIDVEIKSEFSKVLQTIIDSGYSRIPVFEDTPDNVKGILYVKDLLSHLDNDNTFEWQSLIREAYYVPETKMLNDLLEEFQAKKIHMAIVVDEYGGTSGIATLEDILEEIVGDINDELDDEEDFYTILPDGTYSFEGKTQINDFHKVTDTDEEYFNEVRGEAETLAGLILELKGEIPQKNEKITYKNFIFTVISVDNRRIKRLKFELKKEKKK